MTEKSSLHDFAPSPFSVETRGGVRAQVFFSGRTPHFERFFAGYDKAFVLPNEKEGAQGFIDCFDLNFGDAYARLSAAYGPFREVGLIAEDAASGQEIGGANFFVIPARAGVGILVNLNYIFVNAEARRQGNFARLFAAVTESARRLFPDGDGNPAAGALVFIEQNDPFRMSAQAFRRDTQFTGLDQFERLRIWAKLGARIVDFAYRQPALSPHQRPDDTLLYSVIGAEGDRLDCCVLEHHLRRFFAVSVLKGRDPDSDKDARAPLGRLAQACAAGESVRLLDPGPLLSRIARRDDPKALFSPSPRNFREALARSAGT